MPEPYPLEAARQLRAREEEDATRALAAALGAVTEREEATRHAASLLAAHDEETERTALRERERDAAPRTAFDASLVHAWRARRRTESDALRAALDEARRVEAAARAAAEVARVALGEARAQREAVEKHHARWVAERRRGAEVRAEAEADDVAAARRK